MDLRFGLATKLGSVRQRKVLCEDSWSPVGSPDIGPVKETTVVHSLPGVFWSPRRGESFREGSYKFESLTRLQSYVSLRSVGRRSGGGRAKRQGRMPMRS